MESEEKSMKSNYKFCSPFFHVLHFAFWTPFFQWSLKKNFYVLFFCFCKLIFKPNLRTNVDFNIYPLLKNPNATSDVNLLITEFNSTVYLKINKFNNPNIFKVNKKKQNLNSRIWIYFLFEFRPVYWSARPRSISSFRWLMTWVTVLFIFA